MRSTYETGSANRPYSVRWLPMASATVVGVVYDGGMMWPLSRQGGAGPEEDRRRMLDRLRRDLKDPRVVRAMESVPREAFVPADSVRRAYEDGPLPIGEGQTISQPYVVGLMVDALEVRRSDRVLEVGAGSGYQAAVLSRLAREVVAVERIESLVDYARERLAAQGCSNVAVHMAEEALGWSEGAPYDAIIVAAAAPRLPMELVEQLVVGGRLVVPVGSRERQELMKVSRTGGGLTMGSLGPCHFVPLVGPGAWPSE